MQRKFFIFFSILIFLISFKSPLYSTTYIKDNLNGKNIVWNRGHSPYIITGDTMIEEGSTLRILPGTSVKFDGYYKLTIEGNLIVKGNKQNPVVITSNKLNPKANDWKGIVIERDASAEIYYTNIKYGNLGFYCRDSSQIFITNSILESIAKYGIYLGDNSFGVVTNNKFTNLNPEGDITSTRSIACYSYSNSSGIEISIERNSFIDNERKYKYTYYPHHRVIGIVGNVKAKIKDNLFVDNRGQACIISSRLYDDVILNPYVEILNNTIQGLHCGGTIIIFNILSEEPSVIIKNNEIISDKNAAPLSGTCFGAIHFHNSNVQISRNTIVDFGDPIDKKCVMAIYTDGRSMGKFEFNKIVDCRDGLVIALSKKDVPYGFDFIPPTIDIINNSFSGEQRSGINFVQHSNFIVNNFYEGKIIKNNFDINLTNAIDNGTSVDIDATNNWWGTTDIDIISEKIWDKYDNVELGEVFFIPIATVPFIIDY